MFENDSNATINDQKIAIQPEKSHIFYETSNSSSPHMKSLIKTRSIILYTRLALKNIFSVWRIII